MNQIYNIMNLGYETPVLSKDQLKYFPSLGRAYVESMQNYALTQPESVTIFPLVRTSIDGKKYIDIYIYDPAESFEERYVLVPGFKLTDEKEETFEEKLKSKFVRYNFWDDNFVSETKKMGEPYLDNLNIMSHLLLAYYYISFRSGIRELLFKSGLNYLAFFIDIYEEINLAGSTPEELFDLPIKALRMFNNYDMYSYIANPYRRIVTANTYKRYSSFLNEGIIPNKTQWSYLLRTRIAESEPNQGLFNYKFNRSIFNELGEVNDSGLGDKYLKYLYLRQAVGYRLWDNHLPDRSSIDGKIRKLTRDLDYLGQREKLDNGFRIQSKRYKAFEYQNDNYRVRLPKNLDDLLDMADTMNNCLDDYVDEVADGLVLILLIDIKNENDNIAVEVSGDTVEQAYRRFNNELTDEDKSFLFEYCKQKDIYYDPMDD